MAALKGQPAPKPSQVADPVPNEDYAALAAQYAADVGNSPAKLPDSGGEDYTALAAQAGQQASPQEAPAAPQDPSLMQQAGSAAMAGLDAAGRVLDYPGGFMRAGLAGTAGAVQSAITGKPSVVTMDDLKAAGQGRGPIMADYLKRLGVSEGGSWDAPVLGKVTLRGAEGLALDVLTDPLTTITKLTKEMPYLRKLFTGAGKATEALGEAVYTAALPDKAKGAAKAIIEGAPEMGIPGAPVGGAKTIAEHVDQVSSAIGKVRQGLYDKATEVGAVVNMREAPLKKTNEILARLTRNPQSLPLAETLGNIVDSYRSSSNVPLELLSEWKTDIYNNLPEAAFRGGKVRSMANKFQKALASDFAQLVVDTGNKAESGLGTTIEKLNAKWGTLLDATKPLGKAAETGSGGGKLGRMLDAAILAAHGIPAAIAKKGLDLALTPESKTLIGKALMQAGHDGRIPNRLIIDAASARRPSPLKPEPTE